MTDDFCAIVHGNVCLIPLISTSCKQWLEREPHQPVLHTINRQISHSFKPSMPTT
jgi:hypothetical protein